MATTTETGVSFGQVVRQGAALATAGAGFLHLDAAGDHTEHVHLAAFFVLIGVAQFAVAAALARRDAVRRAVLAAAALNGGVLVVWALSRTVGLGFVPNAEHAEVLGWKDVAASGLELASLATLGLAAAMPAAAGAALLAPRAANRILSGMAVGTLALAIPGVLVTHDHEHDGEEAAAHAHAEDPLAQAVHVHDATADPTAPIHEHEDSAEVATNPERTPHIHGEVTDHGPAAATGSHDDGHNHGSPSDSAAPATLAGHDHADGAAPTSAAAWSAGPAAADPLAGPGNLSTVRVGPFPLLPSVSGLDLPVAGIPNLLVVKPGHLNVPMVAVPKPCTNCYLLGIQPDLVYADGTPANLDTGPMLHHTVLFDSSRTDPVCGRDTMIGQFGQRFFAAGNERTGFPLPDGFGMPVGSGMWNGITDLMNTSDQLRIVFIELTVRWVPLSTPGIQPATPVWLDIDSCGDSAYDIGAGVSEQTWDWTSNLTGRVVAAGGHVHDGGVWLAAHNATTGEHVCTSAAGYGTKPAYVGAIESMTWCAWDRLSTLRAGDTIRLTAHYNAATPQQGVMGIMMIFVHQTQDLAAGSSSPYPTDTPPDTGPTDGGGAHHH